MKREELIGKKAFYMNSKNVSNITGIRKLEDGKVIVYLENGIVASADIVYISPSNKEVLSILDKNF